MSTTPPRCVAGAGAVVMISSSLLLTGCAVSIEEPAGSSADATPPSASSPQVRPSPSTAPSADDATSASLPTVAGYDVGQFPPVPLFTLPDLSLLSQAQGSIAIDLDEALADYPDLTVQAAACGDAVERSSASGTGWLYGDGSGSFTGPDGEVWNYGDGSGSFLVGDVQVQNYGDGSGSYVAPELEIWNYGDGSGSYIDHAQGLEIWGYGDGSASSIDTENGIEHRNYGDGSGSYVDTAAGITIWNYGDGSGSYIDESQDLEIWNYGDGTGAVNGVATAVDPIPQEEAVGVFPPIDVLEPVESCGTTISLQDGVLFDFAQSDIRPDAGAVLDTLAAAMIDLGVPAAEIGGHTDAIGSDEENIGLSERRAQAVVAALVERGVASTLDAVGYGESAPVAANEVDGVDNPAGRQLNRRVEIYVPAF